ncbi:MAG: hypothetical protein R3E53_17560 [Myxococcota bacterium]
MKAIGRKTASTETDAATAAAPTRWVPIEAARSGVSPPSISRWMLSRTMMASSIRSPIETERAISVSRFSVKSIT